MRRFLLAMVVVISALVALPASGRTTGTPAASAAPSQGTYEGRNVSIAWNIQRYPASVTVQGQVKNVFYYVLEDVELRATLMDGQGNKVGKDTVFQMPGSLKVDEAAPFSLVVPVPPSTVPGKIQVLYKYREINNQDSPLSPYFFTFDIPLQASASP